MALHYTHTAWWSAIPEWMRAAVRGEPYTMPTREVSQDVWSKLPWATRCIINACERKADGDSRCGVFVDSSGYVRFGYGNHSMLLCPRCQSANAERHKPRADALGTWICHDCWQAARAREHRKDKVARDRHESWVKSWSDAYARLKRIKGAAQCYDIMYSDLARKRDDEIHLAALRTSPGFSGYRMRKSKYEEHFSNKAIRAAASYLLARITGERNPPALLSGVERGVRKDAKGKTASSDLVGA